MTIADEAATFHPEISKLRTDKARRYPAELKQRILEWANRAMTLGIDAEGCARLLGITRGSRITKWQQAANKKKTKAALSMAAGSKPDDKVVTLVPVAVEPRDVGQLVLLTPGGHRIEGLSFEQVRELLTVLS
jgi:hypothetical protein